MHTDVYGGGAAVDYNTADDATAAGYKYLHEVPVFYYFIINALKLTLHEDAEL